MPSCYDSANLASMPVGTVISLPGTAIPYGFLLCDGSAISRSTYANLFSIITTNHGYGDNSTTFNIPDYRGRFLRMVDYSLNVIPNVSGRDPDSGSRSVMNTGGNFGNNVGSVQTDAMQGHLHTETSPNTGGSAGTWALLSGTYASSYFVSIYNTTGPIDDGTNGTPRTTKETRPINAYVNYFIRYK